MSENSRVSKLTLEQKRKKLEANRAKALQRKKDLLNGSLNGQTSAQRPDASNRNAKDNRKNKKMIKKSDYIQYDISNTKDTKGGYIMEPRRSETDKTLDEWRQQQEKSKEIRRVQDPAPPLDISAAPKCYECNTIDINSEFFNVYGSRVCNKCKEKLPEKYSLLTKTECKQDYFLTESELMDTSIFNKIEKPNPHAKFSRMQLFLRYQIEEFAFKKWGGSDGLDEEWLRRQKYKIDKKAKNFEAKLKEMKKRTRAEEYTRKLREKKDDGYGHAHDWSEPLDVDGTVVRRRCKDCGLETEEINF
ncbi:DNA repair protein [Saccharomycopsis crataegensis]|uniref:DNA repair protein n=1 Tax=Saccharomycopsis crataegensis TaxID=43959 RepID=A0AAV5QGH9_9ASCO|nr:DNA repair protein [Saccharomycopsis crataegensis]